MFNKFLVAFEFPGAAHDLNKKISSVVRGVKRVRQLHCITVPEDAVCSCWMWLVMMMLLFHDWWWCCCCCVRCFVEGGHVVRRHRPVSIQLSSPRTTSPEVWRRLRGLHLVQSSSWLRCVDCLVLLCFRLTIPCGTGSTPALRHLQCRTLGIFKAFIQLIRPII